jgi:hypothetical protein
MSLIIGSAVLHVTGYTINNYCITHPSYMLCYVPNKGNVSLQYNLLYLGIL